jgi:hypothetical protein
LTAIASQSIGGIPENITYVYRDHNLESTRGTGFQVNSIDSRIWVADVAPSKAPKTLGDQQVKGAFIRRRTHLDLGRVYYLMRRCVSGILLLEKGFSQDRGTEDPGTHRSLWSDRPCLCWVTHSRSDASWVGTTDVLICIWVD